MKLREHVWLSQVGSGFCLDQSQAKVHSHSDMVTDVISPKGRHVTISAFSVAAKLKIFGMIMPDYA